MIDRRVPARTRRLLSHTVVGLLLTVAALLAGAGTASAHAVLIATDPARDSVLPTLPAQVTLTFGEAVQLPPGGLRVFDPAGVQVDDGLTGHPRGNGNTVRVGIHPGRAQGSYTVAWRVISADTHPVSGAFVFSVGHPSTTPAATAAPPGGSATVGMLYGITRAVGYGSFAALVGAIALLLLCWPAEAAGTVGPRVAAAGWATLVVATVATLLLQGPYGNGTGLSDILDPGAVATTLQLPLGSALVARLLLLAAAAIYLGQLAHRLPNAGPRTRAALTTCGAVIAVAMAFTWSISGHAAVGLQPEIALPVDVAHLLVMSVWLGGLLVLALALRRTPQDRDEPSQLATAVGRFSPLAFGCVAVLVGTGTYQSWRQLGSWSAFLDTAYGKVLLAKLAAVAAMLAAAAVSRRAVHRMRDRPAPVAQTLRRSVLAETALAVVVLGLTALLVNAEPGRTAEAASAVAAQGPVQANLSYDTGGPRGTGTLAVRVDPARTGPDTVDIAVHGPGGAPVDLPEIDAELSLPDHHLGPLPLTVRRLGPGHYQAGGQIPLPGSWELALTVRTSDIDETTVRLPVPIP